MNSSNYRFTLDMHMAQSQISLPVVLNDTKRRLYISLADGGKLYHIEDGCLALIRINRPTGTYLAQFCPIEDNTNIVYDFGQYIYTAIVEGLHECEVTLYGLDGGVLTTARFSMVVSERVVNSDNAEVTDENWTEIDSIVAEEAKRQEAFKKAIADANDIAAKMEIMIKNYLSGVYVGSGEMPEGYNVQVDPEGSEVEHLVLSVNGVKADENGNVNVEAPDNAVLYTEQALADRNKIRARKNIGAINEWNELRNRPFYSIEYGREVIFDGDLTYDTEKGYFYDTSDFTITVGATYAVTWNGVEYICQGNDDLKIEYPQIGNGAILIRRLGEGHEQVEALAEPYDSGEPFLFYTATGGQHYVVLSRDGKTAATMKIELIHEYVLKTLDEKYLPESVFTQPDLTQNDETAKDYVKNRTHYTTYEDVTIIPETEITVAKDEDGYIAATVSDYTLDGMNANDEVITVIDGVEYRSNLTIALFIIAWGNLGLLSDGSTVAGGDSYTCFKSQRC